jgi:hypothetical protein
MPQPQITPQQLANNYARCFETPDGQVVMADLLSKLSDDYNPDANAMYFNAGVRNVVSYIARQAAAGHGHSPKPTRQA